jgi:hypothetical protein
MDMAKLNSRESTEWFNQILVDTGIFRPEATFRGVWIGLQGKYD